MSFDSSTIDRIVAGVLTQLGDGELAPVQLIPEAGVHRAECSVLRVQSDAATPIVIAERVVTAEVLEGVGRGVGVVTVGLKSVVTPAAWDVAKERGIDIRRESRRTSSGGGPESTLGTRPATSISLLIIVHHTEAVGRLWDDLQSRWRREFLGCPDDAAKLAISELSRGGASQVVILAEQAQRAACLANRHASVKAASIRDIADVQATKSQLRANVWCLSPREKSWFELRRLFLSLTPNS